MQYQKREKGSFERIQKMEQPKKQATLLTAAELGKQLNLSRRQIFRLSSMGKIPTPLKIGGAIRWRAAEIANWLEAGAPDRQTWEALRQTGRA